MHGLFYVPSVWMLNYVYYKYYYITTSILWIKDAKQLATNLILIRKYLPSTQLWPIALTVESSCTVYHPQICLYQSFEMGLSVWCDTATFRTLKADRYWKISLAICDKLRLANILFIQTLQHLHQNAHMIQDSTYSFFKITWFSTWHWYWNNCLILSMSLFHNRMETLITVWSRCHKDHLKWKRSNSPYNTGCMTVFAYGFSIRGTGLFIKLAK